MAANATFLDGLVSGLQIDKADQERTQRAWAALSVKARMPVFTRTRHLLAAHTADLIEAIPATSARTPAETLAAEVLPLLEACRYLEREAASVLRARRPQGGLPFWLAGCHSVVERVPLGTVLIIAPANYPLFLAGAQTLQALAAGNAVVWKPGAGGRAAALAMERALTQAGLPDGLLRVTAETVEAAQREMELGPDKIVFTGSMQAGQSVLRAAVASVTPVVAELSGCDAVMVLPGADAARVADALCFGMRLNGSATCMAPRRLLVVGAGHDRLLDTLEERFAAMEPIALPERVRSLLPAALDDARSRHAQVRGAGVDEHCAQMKPLLVRNGSAAMQLANLDVFAPVLTAIAVDDVDEARAVCEAGRYALTVSIFGPERDALGAANGLTAGSVLINDLIVPTADPRLPFGGRRASGFGSTRGAEGLLEMTAPRVVTVRRGQSRRHYAPTGEAHAELFEGVIALVHGRGLTRKFAGLKRAALALRNLA